MKGHGEKLSRKQELAIISLLMEPTITVAAEKTGVSEATLWRWLQQEQFQEAYREAKRQAVAQAIARLQQVSSEAVNTLREIMLDGEAKDTARVTAAKAVLEMAVKGIELDDLVARIETLEKAINNQKGVG